MLVNERGALTFLVPTVSGTTVEFESTSRLVPGRWHLVSLGLSTLNLEISVNGQPDSSFKLRSESRLSTVGKSSTPGPKPASSSESSVVSAIPTGLSRLISAPLSEPASNTFLRLSLGKSSVYASGQFYLDDVRVYARFLSQDTFREMAVSQGVPFADEDLRIGCRSCGFSEASRACSKSFHVCTQQEIYAFAFQVARINGWTRYSKRIWSYSPITDELVQSSDKKLGLCCRSSEFRG